MRQLRSAQLLTHLEYTKFADDAQQFVVSPAWIKCGLYDKVRRFIDRITSWIKRVEQTTSVSWSVEPEILRYGSCRTGERRDPPPSDGCLRSFDRRGNGEFVAE